jgi:predicted ATPase
LQAELSYHVVHRISLTGAQGTGKSTLARAIVDRLSSEPGLDVELCGGAGSQIAGAGFTTGAGASREGVLAFASWHQQREAAASAPIQVFDRCLIDTLAYARVLGCLTAHELAHLEAAAVAASRRATQLLWLRVTTDYPVLRSSDETPEFRRAIDAAIGQFAKECSIALAACAMPPECLDAVVERVCAGLGPPARKR